MYDTLEKKYTEPKEVKNIKVEAVPISHEGSGSGSMTTSFLFPGYSYSTKQSINLKANKYLVSFNLFFEDGKEIQFTCECNTSDIRQVISLQKLLGQKI